MFKLIIPKAKPVNENYSTIIVRRPTFKQCISVCVSGETIGLYVTQSEHKRLNPTRDRHFRDLNKQ